MQPPCRRPCATCTSKSSHTRNRRITTHLHRACPGFEQPSSDPAQAGRGVPAAAQCLCAASQPPKTKLPGQVPHAHRQRGRATAPRLLRLGGRQRGVYSRALAPSSSQSGADESTRRYNPPRLAVQRPCPTSVVSAVTCVCPRVTLPLSRLLGNRSGAHFGTDPYLPAVVH